MNPRLQILDRNFYFQNPKPETLNAKYKVSNANPLTVNSFCPQVLLKNMMTEAEMNDEEECKDIMQDTREKCMEDYGSVVSVLCARAGTECPAERVGQVFVRFGDVGTAIRAAQGLHNVKFDGRVVEVCLSLV